MWGGYQTTVNPMVEAQEKVDIVSFLEDIRGIVEPNRQMILDLMSGIQAHERGIGQLYWQYTQQTSNQWLKEQWEKFGKDTEVNRLVAERVMGALEGDPSYKSSLARDHEQFMRCFTNVQSQGSAGDQIRLGNLVMTENISKLLWKGVHRASASIKDAPTAKILADAGKIARATTEEHVTWNTAMYESYLSKLMLGM